MASASTSGSPVGKRKCSFVRHDEAVQKFPKLAGEVYSINNTRRVSRAFKKTIFENQWMTQTRDTSICRACIIFANEDPDTTPSSSPDRNDQPQAASVNDEQRIDIVDDIRRLIRAIKSNGVPESILMELVTAIGEMDRKSYRDIINSGIMEDKRSSLLTSSYSSIWSSYDCKYLKSYLQGVCEISSASIEVQAKAERHFVSAANSICSVMNQRFICPLSVAQNIVLHSYAGSKTVCQMFGMLHPSGSYKFLANLVENLSLDTPEFPDGDIYVAFDNQQIVGRDYRVTVGASQPSSVVTTFAVYREKNQLRMQYNDIPTDLIINDKNRCTLWMEYIQFDANCKRIHDRFRDDWISERLQIVETEFQSAQGSLDAQINQTGIAAKEYERGLSYTRVDSFPSSCQVFDMENLMINPNSYETVATVLSTITDMSTKTSPDRKWITVICDGVPFYIATKLLKEFKECRTCSISGRKLKCDELPDHDTHFKFSKIVLRPGAGHFELNLVRAIFKGFFDVFIKPVAIMLGYTTPRALDFCRKALDHHKSWQILQIVYVALSDEILHQYVIRVKNAGRTPSKDGFAKWLSDQRWPNLRMAADFAFNLLHSLFLFRAGIRQCNDEVSMAGLHKASSVFFGFNHPKYRYITVRDCLYLLTLPHIGAGPAKQNGFRVQQSQTGQGLDFLLEERNKLQKQWIFAHGVPTERQWKKSSSTLTFFEKLKKGVLSDMGIAEEGWIARQSSLGQPYLKARISFREVLKLESFELTTFMEEPTALPKSFLNWAITCKENKKKFVQAFLNDEKCVLSLLDTTELDSLCDEELRKRASSKIRQLSGSAKERVSVAYKKCKSSVELIELLGEIEEEICNIDYAFS